MGKIAESNAYFPKGDIDQLFGQQLQSKPKYTPNFELKGIGAYLESVAANFLHKNYNVEQFRTPIDSSLSRKGQLERGELKAGQEYFKKDWQKGLGKIIKRRVSIPKRPI